MRTANTKTRKTTGVDPDINNSVKLFKFKCPFTQCSVCSNTQKTLHQHYMSCHQQLNICKFCDKTYNTPHSLKQHLYGHLKTSTDYKCMRCRKKFPFYSQLKIHRLSHTKTSKFTIG